MGAVGNSRDVLKLRDVVEQIENFDDGLTIYAATEWSPDSPVIVAREPEAGGVPPEAASEGMRYFLEIFIAKEVLGGLRDVDLDRKTKRLIRYAITDA
jgi:hypothetical protein